MTSLLGTHSATELTNMIRNGDVTPLELVNELLSTIETKNPSLNAVTSTWPEKARQWADSFKDQGQPFAGIPILLKGLGQGIEGEPDTGSSKLLKNEVASETNNFVKQVINAGFIPVGETNAPEFGFKNITDSELYGDAHNPWNLDFQPGGSSGGAAAAVSDSWLPLATASDGGGSIRIPSSFSGVIGLKPTRGRVPAGPGEWRGWQGAAINFAISNNIQDLASTLNALSVVQMAAPFQVPLPPTPFDRISDLSKDLKIAYSTKSPVGTPVSEAAITAVKNAITFLESLGFKVEEHDAPVDGTKLMQSYYQMNAGETATMFASMRLSDQVIKQNVETLSWALGYTGRGVSAVDYSSSLTFWDNVGAEMDTFSTEYDLYLTPATAYTAPKISEQLVSAEDFDRMLHIEDYNPNEQLNIIWDQWLPSLTLSPFTQLANISGQPGISLPTHISENGLPLGIQFMARKGREDLLLSVGKLFENNNKFQLLRNQK